MTFAAVWPVVVFLAGIAVARLDESRTRRRSETERRRLFERDTVVEIQETLPVLVLSTTRCIMKGQRWEDEAEKRTAARRRLTVLATRLEDEGLRCEVMDMIGQSDSIVIDHDKDQLGPDYYVSINDTLDRTNELLGQTLRRLL